MSDDLLFVGSKEANPAEAENWRQHVSVNPAFASLAHAKRVLMLQGPVGPFFDRVSHWLLARGCQVERVVFQGGDEEDCRAVQPIRFKQSPADWPAFLGGLLNKYRPDCIVLFGQFRIYHKVALERARAIDLPVIVMEEGYFRPGFVTMELWGVNGYSATLDRFTWKGDEAEGQPATPISPVLSQMHFQKMAWHASQHYIAMQKLRHHYPQYQHHRIDSTTFYARYWTRSWFRKALHRGPDRKFQRWLFDGRKPYFFVPLQLEGDSQITHHSPFTNNSEFILRVLPSFAAHAPKDSLLVFRQHPHARGGPGNHDLIHSIASGLGIAHRVFHMTEGDTPDLAEHSLGTVVINSTVGLQAIERGVPLIVLGDALYKQPQFTFAGELDAFWHERKLPDAEVAGSFLAQVKHLTQAPASVYALRSEPLNWPDRVPPISIEHSIF
jgi:capsular polysaccharide export protein